MISMPLGEPHGYAHIITTRIKENRAYTKGMTHLQ